MSLKTFVIAVEQDVLDFLKTSGKTVATVEIGAVQVAIAAAKKTELGQLAMSLIQIFDGHSQLTSAQKMASVVGALIPFAEALVAGGGLPAFEGQVADFVREFAQSAYNDLKGALAQVATNAATKLAAPGAPVIAGTAA